MSSHKKTDVALIQLDAAIVAEREGRAIEAITLAGASEEIFGALCKREGIVSSIEKIIDLPIMKQLDKKRPELVDIINFPRNCLKHAHHPDEDIFEITEYDPYIMISRAIHNLRSLEIEESEEVKEFCHKYASRRFLNRPHS